MNSVSKWISIFCLNSIPSTTFLPTSGLKFKADAVMPTNKKPFRLHHVGFVVTSIEVSAPGFMRSLSASWDGEVFADPNQKVKVAFLTMMPGDAQVELVEANAKDAPINKFLTERGAG